MHSGVRPYLVLGIGNLLMGDDGVGVHAIRKLRQYVLPDSAELMDGAVMGLSLVGHLFNREKVVVIDAVDMGRAPGSLCILTSDDVDYFGSVSPASVHSPGLPQVVQLLRCLMDRPPPLTIIAVQPRSVSLNMSLSAEVAQQLDEIVRLVLAEIAVSTVPAV